MVESPAIYLDLTAEDNLRLQARLLGLPSEEGIAPLLELVGLGETGERRPETFPWACVSLAGDCRGPLWRAGFPGAG